MRFKGAVVNTAIIMACAEGVVMHHDSNFLAINSGHILQSVRTGQNLCCVEWGMFTLQYSHNHLGYLQVCVV